MVLELLGIYTHFSFLIHFSKIFVVARPLSRLRAKNTHSRSTPHADENSNEIGYNSIVPDNSDDSENENDLTES